MRGPNYWSVRYPCLIVMVLNLEELEEKPTNLIDGFASRLEALFPGMYEHQCSEGHPGGFFERVRAPGWAMLLSILPFTSSRWPAWIVASGGPGELARKVCTM